MAISSACEVTGGRGGGEGVEITKISSLFLETIISSHCKLASRLWQLGAPDSNLLVLPLSRH